VVGTLAGSLGQTTEPTAAGELNPTIELLPLE
jgi:hypothetical protein